MTSVSSPHAARNYVTSQNSHAETCPPGSPQSQSYQNYTQSRQVERRHQTMCAHHLGGGGWWYLIMRTIYTGCKRDFHCHWYYSLSQICCGHDRLRTFFIQTVSFLILFPPSKFNLQHKPTHNQLTIRTPSIPPKTSQTKQHTDPPPPPPASQSPHPYTSNPP